MSKTLQILIGLLVSGVALYLAFRSVDFSQLFSVITSAKLWPIAPFIGLWFLHYVLRAIRWRYLLPKMPNQESPPASLRQLFDSIILGALASFILPLRLGEFIRPLILSRWTNYSFATSFASVVIERFFDLAAVLISLVCIVPLLPALPNEALVLIAPLGVLSLGLFVFIVMGCLAPQIVKQLVSKVAKFLPEKIAKFGVSFTDDLLVGASVVKSAKDLVAVVVLTAIIWISGYVQFYVLFMMFPDAYSPLLAVTMGVLVALFVAAPSSPGFVGVFQAGCVAAAALAGYPTTTAQALSLILHALIYLLVVVVGFSLLAVHDLSLSELKKSKQ